MSARKKRGFEAWMLGPISMLLFVIGFAVWTTVSISQLDAECEAQGGVLLRGGCVERSVIIELR